VQNVLLEFTDFMQKHKRQITNNTYKAVDIVCIVNDGANLALWTDKDRSKNIGPGTDKPINLQTDDSQQLLHLFHHHLYIQCCMSILNDIQSVQKFHKGLSAEIGEHSIN